MNKLQLCQQDGYISKKVILSKKSKWQITTHMPDSQHSRTTETKHYII